MHIAAAFRKPIVSVWGNTVPELGMYPYMPGNENYSVIVQNNKLSCRPCSKIGFDTCPKGHFKCMMDLNSREIASKLNSLAHKEYNQIDVN
jgi:heptosyltransferase-2